jgi:hypothetical protein
MIAVSTYVPNYDYLTQPAFALLTLSLSAPCDPLYLTALRLICPIKIGLICPRAVSCGPL